MFDINYYNNKFKENISTSDSMVEIQDDISNINQQLENKYTKEQVDTLISAIVQECDWKESVNTFDDLASTYPTPESGWTVSVKATNITYRYNGSEWIDIYTLINKSQLGLENVDNTSDLDKPISTATQAAIDSINENKLGKSENAVSASKLATPVTINGVEFDGTQNIVVSNMRLV